MTCAECDQDAGRLPPELDRLLPIGARHGHLQRQPPTPPCTGNVLWTVFLDTKPISNRQVQLWAPI